MSAQTERVDVLAVMNRMRDWMPDIEHPDNQMPMVLKSHREAEEAISFVATLIDIHRRLVAWNHNVNGNTGELGEICSDAEAALARIGGAP